MPSTPSASAPICVTGATGYIAHYVVRDLLASGHHVRGTTRHLSDSSKLSALRSLPSADTHLALVEADLLNPDSLALALEGVCTLVHVATPVIYGPDGKLVFSSREEAETRQIRPAIEGTRNLFSAAAEAGVKRVVLTSSSLAMSVVPKKHDMLDESCWTDEKFADSLIETSSGGAYVYSKIKQERLSWDLAREHGLSMVTINPGLVIGPSLTGNRSGGHDVLVALAEGRGWVLAGCKEGTLPDSVMDFVDVRDVAAAHVLCVEKEEAEGRFLLVGSSGHVADVVRTLREADPAIAKLGKMAVDSEDGEKHVEPTRFNAAKSKALGVEYLPWEESVRDSAKVIMGSGGV